MTGRGRGVNTDDDVLALIFFGSTVAGGYATLFTHLGTATRTWLLQHKILSQGSEVIVGYAGIGLDLRRVIVLAAAWLLLLAYFLRRRRKTETTARPENRTHDYTH